ncbi:tRNA-specific adenosine deaminase [Candidatus Profftia lariciata]|uniref:tRNA adenosine(34) deaminase TadA n=1 Tax=Candidatus Profftia lariciata TaxID=1987921 RepID=UPI001D02648C|nr:tRNA adenosine(34) deaminase TadA [Candidatus Profftia lariciata]UDG81686.1 tRNA-specific adenosine deaminase [Candidatus Profftia lariciata]
MSELKLDDNYWMQQALILAQKALEQGEVPIGAILVLNFNIIGRGWNRSIKNHDPTAHAEIIALQQGGQILQNYRLLNSTMYVTLEPCIMCAGAILHSRIKHLIYGASNIETGAVNSVLNIFNHSKINHKIKITSGIMDRECSEFLKNFFQKRRHQ